ncbi:hypothetical protein VZ94_10855 [Methylocucumis oryzae]|uniref:Outer membrane receptor for ferric coprogen and ferric-rhodotorulic acid n=1 Tax=Methylocucumis oryzae TaxID=1632867 RepID=A0A0F3IIJ6_9GAMM|nr:hypothetical protein VZ94_10855 [Methylocucumis oryzae]
MQLKQAIAEEREDLLELKNTAESLIDVFVQQGLLDKQKADVLLRQAKTKSAQLQQEEPALATDKAHPNRIRVTHVPKFIKDEIRAEVVSDLTNKVTQQVKADAKTEHWGVPEALPGWLNKIRITADARLRLQEDSYGSGNSPYLDYLAINRDGGSLAAYNRNEQYLNTTQDRLRLRERFRLGLEMQITDEINSGFRLTTTNDFSPVSSNQTMGNTGQTYQVAVDRAFIQYQAKDSWHKDWLTVTGGRMANPWLSTEMQFSPDLSVEGFTFMLSKHFNYNQPNVKQYRAPEANSRFGVHLGPQTPDSVFLTAGVFPLQEVNLSTTDKWLFAGQVGMDWLVQDSSRLKLAASYYDYQNVRAIANARDSFTYDWTAPQFMQKGNTLVPINRNDGFNSRCTSSQTFALGEGCLYGLASDFKIFNAVAVYDFAKFQPVHALFSIDYAYNLGYDAGRIARDFPGYFTGSRGLDNKERTQAVQLRLDLGHSEIRRFNDWSAIIAYRYVQRDAVLDAFTDTIFHQGGTDAKGWMIGGSYGLAKNTWAMFRWFSTEAIDGPPLDIDTLALDLNIRL